MGTAKISLTVAKISGEDVQVVFHREKASHGIRNSAIYNPKQAGEVVGSLVREAEDELKIKILQVVLGLPKCNVRQESSQARYERSDADSNITEDEVYTLKNMAQDSYPIDDPTKEELYEAVAQSFSGDDEFQYSENDIVGVVSSVFEGDFRLFIGKRSPVRNAEKIFTDLGIAVGAKYFPPKAMAKAVLKEDELENGVALVDLGGGATTVSVFQGKILRYYASIPFGGNIITSDIKTESAITDTLAENIKKAFGACMPEKLQSMSEKIIQIDGDEMTAIKQLPVKYLSEVITCRAKEIVDAVLYHIQASGFADNLRRGVVISGGGAELGNIAAFIRDISGYNVRIGYPMHKFSSAGILGLDSPAVTTAIGMILLSKGEMISDCAETSDSSTGESIREKPADTVKEPVEESKAEETAPTGETDREEPEEEGDKDLFGNTIDDKKKKKGFKIPGLQWIKKLDFYDQI